MPRYPTLMGVTLAVMIFVSQSSSAATENVIWTSPLNVTATGNSLKKTGGCNGCDDAGAVSQQQIPSGDGYIEFTIGETALVMDIR